MELAAPDVVALLAQGGMDQAPAPAGRRVNVADADFVPLVLRPSKIACLGLNYRGHIAATSPWAARWTAR